MSVSKGALINCIKAKLLVGGENLNNEEVKERKKKRKRHADKKRNEIKRMAEAVRFFSTNFNSYRLHRSRLRRSVTVKTFVPGSLLSHRALGVELQKNPKFQKLSPF